MIRNRRTAIDAADEADIGIAILLAMIVQMEADRETKVGEAGLGAGKLAESAMGEGTNRDSGITAGGGLDERAGGEDRQGA